MEDLTLYEDIDSLDFLPEDIATTGPFPPFSSSFSSSSSFSAKSSSSTNSYPASISEAEIRKQIKKWICIYPIYFDAKRSKFPRRVPKHLSHNDVTLDMIADALRTIPLPCVIEPDKTHPQDPLRPGRVRTTIPKPLSRRALFRKIGEKIQTFPPAIMPPSSSSSSSSSHSSKSNINKKKEMKKSKK